ncbi:hypothetical protein ZIOFF_050851 [Zingiber officinale]|uniref:Uncharacterized protein n=1 Tax=Zingiber officinale TaxID=94328 RepID=A0A8J5FQI1_ZINOF|nr:hypothetical protein ZIOFF_050851 [Zingiber officinale]
MRIPGGTRNREFRFIKGGSQLVRRGGLATSAEATRSRPALVVPAAELALLASSKKKVGKKETSPFLHDLFCFPHLYSRRRAHCSGETPSISPSRRTLDALVPPPGPLVGTGTFVAPGIWIGRQEPRPPVAAPADGAL